MRRRLGGGTWQDYDSEGRGLVNRDGGTLGVFKQSQSFIRDSQTMTGERNKALPRVIRTQISSLNQ